MRVRRTLRQLGEKLTRRKEKMIHPRKSHRPMLNGIGTQPLCASGGQLLKMAFDHDVVVSMVIAVKISET